MVTTSTRISGRLLVLLLGFTLNASSPQEKPGQLPLEHKVTVSLKLIQVFVMDKHGRPMTDLEKTDFEVFDDGQLKTITEFEKHATPAPAKAEEAPAKPSAPPGWWSKAGRPIMFSKQHAMSSNAQGTKSWL